MEKEKTVVTTIRLSQSLKNRLDRYVSDHDMVQERFLTRLITEKLNQLYSDSTEQMVLDLPSRGSYFCDRDTSAVSA